MNCSTKDVTNKNFLGCVEISSEDGFHLLLTHKHKTSISAKDEQTKLFYIAAILNNIEANLMIDLGVALVGGDSR